MPSASTDDWRWSDQIGWFTAVVLAALLQAIVIWRSPLIARDGLDFIRFAQRLPTSVLEQFRVQDQHPGYPLMVLVSSEAVRPFGLPDTEMWIQAARIPPMLFGLGSVVVVWLLTRRVFDRWVADIAALVFAAMPIFRQSASDGLSDTPHLFFYLLAAWLVCEGLARSSWRWFAGAGAASAAAYWIRPEGLAVALVAGMTLLLLLAAARGREWRSILLCGGALTVATLVLAFPYPLASGKFTSKQNPYAQQQPRAPYLVNEAAAQAAPAVTDSSSAAISQSSPAASGITLRFLTRTLGRALYEFGDEIVRGFRFFYLVFYLLGYFELRKRSLNVRLLVFLYALATLHFLLLIGVFFMSGYISHRHVMPLIALAMPWIALGILYAAEIVRRVFRMSRPSPALGWTIAVLCCAIVIPRATRQLHEVFLPTLEAAEWIRNHSRPADRMLTNSKYVSYFSERPSIFLTDRYPTVEDALRQVGGERDYKIAVLDLAEDGFQQAWLLELTTPTPPLFRMETVGRGQVKPRLLVFDGPPTRVATAEAVEGGGKAGR